MRVPRLSPATLIAIAALILAAGGLAVAAIPGSDGSIHACYKKQGGDLRVVKGTKCKDGERPLAWSQGVDHVIVRTKTLTIPVTCSGSGDFRFCNGSGTGTVACKSGERATGGGYGQSASPARPSSGVQESKPSPVGGKPTGWTIVASAFSSGAGGATASEAPAQVPIYVVCAD